MGRPVPMAPLATEEQTQMVERVAVLESIRRVFSALPCKVGDKALCRAYEALGDALHEARRRLPPADLALPRPVDGAAFTRAHLPTTPLASSEEVDTEGTTQGG